MWSKCYSFIHSSCSINFVDNNNPLKLFQLPSPDALFGSFSSSNLPFSQFIADFKCQLHTLKWFTSAYIKLRFVRFFITIICLFIQIYNESFYTDKGHFIQSLLNCFKRSIVLDQILVFKKNNSALLLLDPSKIKVIAIYHFQNIIGPSNSPFSDLSSLSDW